MIRELGGFHSHPAGALLQPHKIRHPTRLPGIQEDRAGAGPRPKSTRPTQPGCGQQSAQALETRAWWRDWLRLLRAGVTRDSSGFKSQDLRDRERTQGGAQLLKVRLEAGQQSPSRGSAVWCGLQSADSSAMSKEPLVQWRRGGDPLLRGQF